MDCGVFIAFQNINIIITKLKWEKLKESARVVENNFTKCQTLSNTTKKSTTNA